jgi:predicted transposase/invertase (TIGR01784 family)
MIILPLNEKQMFKEKYINPFTDYGFKRLFGEEPNKDLLIDFLNTLIKKEGRITDIAYLKNEKLGAHEISRKAVFDIYCENERGEKFIVEMQKAKQNYFKDRSVYYSAFPIQEQAIQGDWNFELKAIYTIGILDFVFDENKENEDYFHWEVQLMETSKKTVFFDKLTYIYLEMPKFKKTENNLVTQFDKWLFVLKNLPTLQNRPEKLQEKVFERLFEVAEIAKFRPEERMAYEDSLKGYRDLKNVIDTAVEDATKEKTFEIARALKKNGATTDLIIKSTGLDKDEIERL